jgi:ATP-dependent DNA helicase RecQ
MDMSASRPSSLEQMLTVSGVGRTKLSSYGQLFLDSIELYCRSQSIARDVQWKTQSDRDRPTSTSRLGSGPTGTKSITIPLLRQGRPLEEIADMAAVTPGTVASHLQELMETESVASIDNWVSVEVQRRIVAAANEVGREKLKPIFEHMNQEVPYEQIRLVLKFERQS